MKEYTPEEVLYKAAAYCSQAEHCESEVRTKITAWGMPEETLQDTIIDYLYEEKYISDERYCKAFVHDKLLYSGWGKMKIRTMLAAKRLPNALIREALEGIDEEEYLSILQKALVKKNKSISKEEPDVRHAKLLRFAASRGFTYNEIEKVISTL